MDFVDALAVVRRNLKLIKLDGNLLTEVEKKGILSQYREGRKRCQFDVHQFEMSILDLDLQSINKRLGQYMASFKSLLRGDPSPIIFKAEEIEPPDSKGYALDMIANITSTGSWLRDSDLIDLEKLHDIVTKMQDQQYQILEVEIQFLEYFISEMCVTP